MLTPEDIQQINKIIRDKFQLLLGFDSYTFQKHIKIFDAHNIQLGRTTGTKIGTATDQKLGFFNATPVLQQVKTDHNNWNNISDVTAALLNLGLIDAGGGGSSSFSSRARAYSSAGAQSINANTATKVVLDTENYDGDGEFASSTFTAVTAGYYAVTGEATIQDLDVGEIAQALIYVNGAEYSRNAAHSALANTIVRVTISDICYVAAGQTVELYAYHNSAEGAKSINAGSTVTFLAIHRLS